MSSHGVTAYCNDAEFLAAKRGRMELDNFYVDTIWALGELGYNDLDAALVDGLITASEWRNIGYWRDDI